MKTYTKTKFNPNSISIMVGKVNIAPPIEMDRYYGNDYLTFKALENSNFNFSVNSDIIKTNNLCFSYSLNNGKTWETIQIANDNYYITTPIVTKGKTILFKGNFKNITEQNYIGKFSSSGKFEVYGNIMSLLYDNDFKNKKHFPEYIHNDSSIGVFSYLFVGCSNLINAKNLILPATTLMSLCYYQMFYHCSSLKTVPKLPATTLSIGCYLNMFLHCTSLKTTPKLPATVLAPGCYGGMFCRCTSLTSVPELPATTLEINCYQSMFSGCTALTTAPKLPATTLASGCYGNMFSGCSSLTSAPELPATTLAAVCYDWMFEGCRSLTLAPELPATTLAQGCYEYMFASCTSLTTAPSLPATTLANNCYTGMFCKCTSLTAAPELPSITLSEGCYESMFEDCSSLTTAPILPALELVNDCYNYIFYNCSKLKYIKALFITTPGQLYTKKWVYNVSLQGLFIKNENSNYFEIGENSIPSGWTIETDSE